MLHRQVLAGKNNCGKGSGEDTITSGLEGAWSESANNLEYAIFENLFKYDWHQTKAQLVQFNGLQHTRKRAKYRARRSQSKKEACTNYVYFH